MKCVHFYLVPVREPAPCPWSHGFWRKTGSVRDRRQGTGDRGQETGDRGKETGDESRKKEQETGGEDRDLKLWSLQWQTGSKFVL